MTACNSLFHAGMFLRRASMPRHEKCWKTFGPFLIVHAFLLEDAKGSIALAEYGSHEDRLEITEFLRQKKRDEKTPFRVIDIGCPCACCGWCWSDGFVDAIANLELESQESRGDPALITCNGSVDLFYFDFELPMSWDGILDYVHR